MLGPWLEVVEPRMRVTKRVLIMNGQDLAVVVQALELKADKGPARTTAPVPSLSHGNAA